MEKNDSSFEKILNMVPESMILEKMARDFGKTGNVEQFFNGKYYCDRLPIFKKIALQV